MTEGTQPADRSRTHSAEQYREERFSYSGTDLLIRLPRSVDDLIDASPENVDERLPYWAELWPSARVLARWILDAPALPDAAVEIGCGIALPSLVLASRGVRVLACDYYADALVFARENALRNGAPELMTLEMDWREIPVAVEPVPLVVASDVLYEARNIETVLSAIGRVTSDGGEVWIADPGRVHIERFLKQVPDFGWRIDVMTTEIEPSVDGRSRHRVTIYRLTRR